MFFVFVLTACSPNSNFESQSSSNQTNTSITPSIGTNVEPDYIIIYNKGRTTTLEKGTKPYNTVKSYIYKMINEKSYDIDKKQQIAYADINMFEQQQAFEFHYSNSVEFEYLDKSTKLINEFWVALSVQPQIVITSSIIDPNVSNGQFSVRLDSNYESLIAKYAK